ELVDEPAHPLAGTTPWRLRFISASWRARPDWAYMVYGRRQAMSSRIAGPSGSNLSRPSMRHTNNLRRRFLGFALVACLPVAAHGADPPVKLAFEYDPA